MGRALACNELLFPVAVMPVLLTRRLSRGAGQAALIENAPVRQDAVTKTQRRAAADCSSPRITHVGVSGGIRFVEVIS